MTAYDAHDLRFAAKAVAKALPTVDVAGVPVVGLRFGRDGFSVIYAGHQSMVDITCGAVDASATSMVLHARRFAAFFAGIPGAMARLSLEGDRLVVAADVFDIRAEFTAVEAPFPQAIAIPSRIVAGGDARTLLSAVIDFAQLAGGADAVNPILKGVELMGVDGGLRVQATNGIYAGGTVIPATAVAGASVIIPATAMGMVSLAAEIGGEAAVRHDKDLLVVTVESGDRRGTFGLRSIVGAYPAKVSDILSTKVDTVADVSISELGQALRFLRLITERSSPLVDIQVNGSSLVVSGRNASFSEDGQATVGSAVEGSLSASVHGDYVLRLLKTMADRGNSRVQVQSRPGMPMVFLQGDVEGRFLLMQVQRESQSKPDETAASQAA